MAQRPERCTVKKVGQATALPFGNLKYLGYFHQELITVKP
jgi:hypothetical protein